MNKLYEELSIAQIKVLSLIAWSNGKVSEPEKILLEEIIEKSLCSETIKNNLKDYILISPSFEEVSDSLVKIPKEIVGLVLRNAYSIAIADNKVDDVEIEVIDRLAKILGIEEEHIEVFHKWLELSYQVENIETKLFRTKIPEKG